MEHKQKFHHCVVMFIMPEMLAPLLILLAVGANAAPPTMRAYVATSANSAAQGYQAAFGP